MTTDLTKTFFDTFGIEPKLDCKRCGAKNFALGQCAEVDCEKTYPEITDRILLEMICICSQYGFYSAARNIKILKLRVLKRLLELKKNLKNNYEHQGCHNAFARKVRTLFNEGK